jgi:hypothetical protein
MAKETHPGVHFFSADEKSEISFDLIFVAGVFHHVDRTEREMVFNDILKSLCNTGKLCIFEHNPYNPMTRFMVRICPFDKGVRLVAPAEMASLISIKGLSIKDFGFSLFFPPFLSFLSFIEKGIKRVPLGTQYYYCISR